MADDITKAAKRTLVIGATAGIFCALATPASADPILTPLILAALGAAGLPTTIGLFGVTIGVAPLLSGLVTTPVGRNFHFRCRR